MGIVSLEPQNSRIDRWTRAGDQPRRDDPDELSVGAVLDTVRRHAKLILATTVAFIIGALLLNSYLPKSYQSQTRVLIDPRGLQVVDKGVTPGPGGNELNITLVESEMRIISSDAVLGRVVKKLNLANDPEFNDSKPGLFSFLSFESADTAASKEDAVARASQRALSNLRDQVEVDRTSKSFIVDVMASAQTREKAQRIVATIADEYIAERIESRSGTAARASKTLTSSLDELRKRVEKGEQAVEKYKRDNDIVGASGQLVNEQQLAELNTQLGAARAEATRARGRLEQVNRLRNSGLGAEATLEAIQSPTIAALRSRLADIQRREAALSVSLLPSHPRMLEVRNESRSARRQLDNELARIATTARLDAERAESTETTLTENLQKQKSVASNTNEKSVRLRELEREVEANRSVYNAFLTRSRELSEETRVDSSVAEVISPANRPNKPQRSTSILLLLSTLAGLGAGLGAAFISDATDKQLRTARQVKSLTGVKRVLEVPRLTDAILPRQGIFGGIKQRRAIRRQTSPLLPAFYKTSPKAPASGAIANIASELRAQLAGDPNPSVLLTALDHGEAKSTVALNLALAAADNGNSVLLIDADFDRKSISRKVGALAKPGLLNVLDGNARLATAVLTDTEFPFTILPAGNRRRGGATPVSDGGGEPRALTRRVLQMTRNFDLVIIDDGLLRNKRRVENWATVTNAFYVVVREGLTNKEDLQNSMNTMGSSIHEQCNAILVTDEHA